MSALQPTNTTWGDLCQAAMRNAGRLGPGQTANAQDIADVWAMGQMMLQEWQQKRWLIYHLVTYTIVSTGATSYTFGPGGQINTNQVAAWQLTALSPLADFAGSGYYVGEVITLAARPASGTPSSDQTVQVTEVSSGEIVSVSPDLAAVGSIQFFANPVDLETITLDGVVWTFVAASTGSATETVIQASADLTLAQLVTDLNASTNASISLADYTTTGALASTSLRLRVMYSTTGTEGNDFTLAASTATVSGSTLSGGAANSTLWPGPLPNTWTQASTTGEGISAQFGFAEWEAGDAIATNSGSQRPAKIESAFVRQVTTSAATVDYYLDILQSMEDYNKIALKSMQALPSAVFLDSQWPLGNLFAYPVPQASTYSLNITVRETLATQYATLATAVNLPFEYYSAIVYNLAIRCRPIFQITSYPGDPLPGLATNALNVLRGPNTQIARLVMPGEVMGGGSDYNIFSDRMYGR